MVLRKTGWVSILIIGTFLTMAGPDPVKSNGKRGLSMKNGVRLPAVAGQFYPDDPEVLRNEIKTMFEKIDNTPPAGTIIALVSPHAGYVYSGQVAAEAFARLEEGQFETVVVISPCHIDFFPYASIFHGDAYRTPLGDIQIDSTLAVAIAGGSDLIKIGESGHVAGSSGRGEHSLEVQLPFLQVALGEFKLVPIVMGDQSADIIKELAAALGRELKDRNVLMVASTDLSHFHSAGTAESLDRVFIENLTDLAPDKLMRSISTRQTEACGGGPTAAVMIAAKELGADCCTILKYADSGDVSGDDTSVVGYVSASISRSSQHSKDCIGKEKLKEQGSLNDGMDNNRESGLTDSDMRFLLSYARHILETSFNEKKTELTIPTSAILREKRGGFVTLHKNNRLRGCIGYIEAIKPLIDTIAEMAEAAAFHDHRFPPLRKEELLDITIEISVLSPVRKIEDVSNIVVGKHGIIISAGGHRGLLLPQVATEWKWDRETFLSQTCLKAGLDPDAWKDKETIIEIFSAKIFSEKEMGMR
ncbi:MAG: AmmeMemoRadiSam system protein B [Candidatus Krumholzibacteria bacterium]|nr:AmmeMemoRadiSam system protein B [Candidatus Krumholzibacteria bacterium]